MNNEKLTVTLKKFPLKLNFFRFLSAGILLVKG
ncbi:MAG: hypothetical protein JWP78_2211 [Mucilaginibacter sp.]|nr:hypothetical protein [Mucilaginibacter sp.]